MKTYTVIGVYADNYQRWADVVNTESPAEAESAAVAGMEAGGQLIIAGVIEGNHTLVDQDPVSG